MNKNEKNTYNISDSKHWEMSMLPGAMVALKHKNSSEASSNAD